MENEENSTRENPSKRTANQEKAMGIERSVAKSKIFAIKSEKENAPTQEINAFRKEAKKNNNEILKETTTLEFYSEGVNDTEKGNKSVRESTENSVAKITVDQLDKTRSLREESSYDGSKREIKNPRKIGDMGMTGKRHHRSFRDLIGKREQRKEELEKVEGDLRQRLDILECSMPAVMVWNIWRMSQGAPACRMKRILEKQFEGTRELSCRSTPSRHYDCRVREVEAERKLTLKKVEEARALWSEKLARLEEREKKLEEARRIQEEQKNAMERLSEEAKALRETAKEAMETDESCQYGECGDTRCKQKWLDKIASVTSIESGDIKCLEKLQQLAEEEVAAKRDIAELEHREEAYMRTLQQADELWSKIEVDTVSATSALQEKLDMKIAVNQQLADRVCELEDALEKCQARLAACRTELEKFLSIEKVEATIGRDDDVAKVADKEVTVRAKIVHRPVGRVNDVATVKDDEVLTRVEVTDGETLARVEVTDEESLAKIASIDADAEVTFVGDDKFVSVKPDLADLAIDRPSDLVEIEDAESVVRPEDFTYEQQKFKEVREYLAKLGSLEELYKDDGKTCAPDFVCNDEVFSPTGMTDEELIALGVEPTVLTRKHDEKTVVSEEERNKREELPKPNDVEAKAKKADEISDVEIERKEVIEGMEERIPEIVDMPVNETVMHRAIQEEAANDVSITIPDDVRAPEVKMTETDRDIVLQRDTILSWVDTLDTIRTKAAKHPNCHTVKKDADILAEEIGSYIGIELKEIEGEIITADNKQGEIEYNDKIKTEREVTIQINLQESIASRKIESVTKSRSIPLPHPEETSERKVPNETPMKPIAESELPPTLTKEEISIGMESPTAVSIEDSFQPLTIPTRENLKDHTVPLNELVPDTVEIEKIKMEDETQITEIVQNTKGAEIAQVKKVEKDATVRNLVNNKLNAGIMANDKMVDSTKKEETSVVPEVEKKDIISQHVEKNEKEADVIVIETMVETVRADKTPEKTDENGFAEEMMEDFREARQPDEIKMIDIEETKAHMEIDESKEARETAKVLPIAEIKEIEQAEKAIPAVEEKTPEIISIPETISPTMDLIEMKIFETNKLPIDGKVIEDVEEEEIKIEEFPSISKEEVEKIELNELPIVNIGEVPIIAEEKIEVEEPSPILNEKEVSLIPDAVVEEKESEASIPITDIIQEKIEITELPQIMDVLQEEKIEMEPSPIADVVTEEKVEMVQPVTELLPTIKKEVEETETIKQPVSEIDIKKEKDEEIVKISEEVTPPVEILEEREEKEIPSVKKQEILAEVVLPTEPTVKEEKKEVPVEEKKPEVVEIELQIPITEMKPIETEIPAIPIDPRLMAQSYLIIAKIKEMELLGIIPAAKPSSASSYLQPPIEIAQPVGIKRTDAAEIVQTEVVRTKVAQSEIVQTEIVETEVVQITTQTVPTAEPTRTSSIRTIRNYLKPAELKAPSTEIAGDRPEITVRKMLWRKRLKDQSTVTTASTGSQTDRTSHVSHDRVVRDERERARVPTDELLRAIKIAAELARPDAERKIRTINYGGRSDETTGTMACNCCWCGKISTTSSTGSRLEIQPQIDAKTATPPAFAAFERVFIPPKIDRLIPYDRLCPDCRAKIQSKMSREKQHTEKIIQKISHDQESCGCASSTGKPCRAVARKKVIEKKDQSCLAKISKRKINLDEEKRKVNLQPIPEDSRKLEVEPLSPSCICFKLEKTGVEPIRKGNCYCAN